MTRDNLRDAIDRMSEKAVDRFLQREDILTEKPKKERAKRRKLIISTLAACLCLCFAIGGLFTPAGRSLWAMLTGKDPSTIMLDKNLANRPAGDHPIIALQSYESGRVHFLYNGKLLSKTVNANEGLIRDGVSDDENKVMYISNAYRDKNNVRHEYAYFVAQDKVTEVKYKVRFDNVRKLVIESDGDIWLFSGTGIFGYHNFGRKGISEYECNVGRFCHQYQDHVTYNCYTHGICTIDTKNNVHKIICEDTEIDFDDIEILDEGVISYPNNNRFESQIYFIESGKTINFNEAIKSAHPTDKGSFILTTYGNTPDLSYPYNVYSFNGESFEKIAEGISVSAVNNNGTLIYGHAVYNKNAYAISNGNVRLLFEGKCELIYTDNLEELLIFTDNGILLSRNGGEAVKISDTSDITPDDITCTITHGNTFAGKFFFDSSSESLYYLDESYKFIKVEDNISIIANSTYFDPSHKTFLYYYFRNDICFVIDNDNGTVYMISPQSKGKLEPYGKIETTAEPSLAIACSDDAGIYIYIKNDKTLYYINQNTTTKIADNISVFRFNYDSIIYREKSENYTETSPLYKYYYSKNGSDGAFVVECETMYAEDYENITYIFAYTGISDENNNRVYDVYGITAADKIECIIKGVYN